MANQPLLRNWPRKLPNWRNNVNYTAITSFRVIQCHRFWYDSKAHV